jgi:hypothetical protein
MAARDATGTLIGSQKPDRAVSRSCRCGRSPGIKCLIPEDAKSFSSRRPWNTSCRKRPTLVQVRNSDLYDRLRCGARKASRIRARCCRTPSLADCFRGQARRYRNALAIVHALIQLACPVARRSAVLSWCHERVRLRATFGAPYVDHGRLDRPCLGRCGSADLGHVRRPARVAYGAPHSARYGPPSACPGRGLGVSLAGA